MGSNLHDKNCIINLVIAILKRPFLVIIALGFILYFPSLFGSFVWDDEDFVFANRYVQNYEIRNLFTHSITSGRDKESNYFRPVQGVIYATTYQLVGPTPFWFHLLNILVHLGATSAVFVFFKKIQPNDSSILPLLISLIFLIHPVQTEAISYISGLSDPLFVLFGFLSLISFLLKDERKNMVPLSLIFFILSILSKETGLVFLPLLFCVAFINNKSITAKGKLTLVIRETLPFILITLGYLTYHFSFINNFDVKASWGDTPYGNSLSVRLLTFIQNLFTYVSLLLFPKDLFMERDFSVFVQTTIVNPFSVMFTLTNLGILGMFFLIRRSKTFRPKLPVIVFCYLAFFISFVPYTGIVLINGIFYEHFLYLPLIFFFAFWLILLWPEIKTFSKVSTAIIILFLVCFAGRNLARQQDWLDPVRFYSQTHLYAPRSTRIINGLGIAYFDQGDYAKAIQTYTSGIQINPFIPNFYHNIATSYLALENLEEAEKYYLQAIEIDQKFIFSWQALAKLYQTTGQTEKLSALTDKFRSLQKASP